MEQPILRRIVQRIVSSVTGSTWIIAWREEPPAAGQSKEQAGGDAPHAGHPPADSPEADVRRDGGP